VGCITVDEGLTKGFVWVSKTTFAQWCEKAGKSKLIDTFTREGCVGLHRAGDKLHDPLLGFFFSLEEFGPMKTVKTWIPHMLADLWTEMSSPLPFMWAVSSDSWWHQLYRKHYNVKTAVLGPAAAVALTELVVRTNLVARLIGSHDDDRDLEKELLIGHSVNATMSGAAIVAAKSLGLSASALATYHVVLLASGVVVVVLRRQDLPPGGSTGQPAAATSRMAPGHGDGRCLGSGLRDGIVARGPSRTRGRSREP